MVSCDFIGPRPRVRFPGVTCRNRATGRAAGRPLAGKQGGRLQVIGALRAMHVIQCPDCLQLDEKHVSGQQAGAAAAGHNAMVMYFDSVLLVHREASIAQFLRRAFSWTFFGNPTPSVFGTVNAQPVTRPDRPLSRALSACSACIFCHLRLNTFGRSRSPQYQRLGILAPRGQVSGVCGKHRVGWTGRFG
jgi:hypothetical protein